MKKLPLVFLIFVLIHSLNYAQLIRGYGIKVGATIASQDWDYSESVDVNLSPDNRSGLNIGVFAEFLDIPFFSVVTELNYVQKGLKEDIIVTSEQNPLSNNVVEWDSRIDYINISALGKLRLNYLLFKPYLVLGPKIDFEIGKESNFNGGIEDDFETSRIGLKVGIGTEISLLPVTLMAELLYDADFNELYENENLKVNTSSFDLRLGIMF